MYENGGIAASMCFFSNFSKNADCIDDSLITNIQLGKDHHFRSKNAIAYPNPLTENELLSLKFEGLSEEKTVTLSTLSGTILFEHNTVEKQMEISASILTKGIYILKVVATDFVEIKKIILQ